MNKPSCFKLVDFLSFGLLAIISFSFTIYGIICGALTAEPVALLILMSMVFVGIYIYLVLIRKSFIDKYTLGAGKILVNPNGYHLTQEQLDNEIKRLKDLYIKVFPNYLEDAFQDWIWVNFEPNIITLPYSKNTKVYGFVTQGGSTANVSYSRKVNSEFIVDPDMPIKNTCAGHELGHLILGRLSNMWGQEESHAFMRAHGLP